MGDALARQRGRAVARRVHRHPLPAPTPSGAAVAAVRPRQALDLRADSDPLARGHDGADPRNEPVFLAVLEQRPEQLGCASDHGFRVTNDDEELLRAGDRDVDPVGVVEESNCRAVVGSNEREDHRVRLTALECVDRLDVVRRHDALERSLQPVDLRVVHRDHGELGLADAPADDRRDVLAERNLELVRDRALRVAVFVLRSRVDPYQLAVERPRQRHARVRRLVDELPLVEEVGDDAADWLAHAVLARQHDA